MQSMGSRRPPRLRPVYRASRWPPSVVAPAPPRQCPPPGEAPLEKPTKVRRWRSIRTVTAPTRAKCRNSRLVVRIIDRRTGSVLLPDSASDTVPLAERPVHTAIAYRALLLNRGSNWADPVTLDSENRGQSYAELVDGPGLSEPFYLNLSPPIGNQRPDAPAQEPHCRGRRLGLKELRTL